MMPSQEQHDEPARKRRCKAACKQCRQSKVKCGMEQIPCHRCQRMGYACEWDPQFRRTRNQDRFRELEERLRVLQQAGAVNPNTVPTPSSVARSSTPTHTATSHQAPDTGTDPRQVQSHNHADDLARPHDDTSFSVGDIKLSFEDATSIFAKFFEKYHIHVPFVECRGSPADCHQESEILFWTIISVGAREQQPHKDFLSNLSPYFKETIRDIVLDGAKSLQSIQALLLQALWPPSNVSFWGDKSMTLASLAVTNALHLGLHNPGYEQEYTNVAMSVEIPEAERSERIRTWIACVSVAQNLALDFGLPLRLPFTNWKIQEIATLESFPGIPVDLQHYLIIHQHAYNIFANMPERGNAPEGSPFDDALLTHINKADLDFHRLVGILLPTMSLLNRLRYATVQLHLRSMHFHLTTATLGRKQGILSAYETATSLITTLLSDDSSSNSDLLTYTPRTTTRMLLQAVCVVFKTLFSSYRTAVDRPAGKILFNAALLCLRPQSVQWQDRKDLPLRCVDFMKGLWHLGDISPSLSAAPPDLAVQTRLGASVKYHCLAIFFDRLQVFYRQREERETTAVGDLSTGFDISDVDPAALAFADFELDFGAWDLGLAQQPDLHYYL